MTTNSTNTDPNEKPINLYFGGLAQSGLLDGSNRLSSDDGGSLKFIILQNDQLHKQVEEMKQKVKDLEDEVYQLDASNDSLEKTRNCLRGYIKNEHDTAKIYKKLYNNNHLILYRRFIYCLFLLVNVFTSLFFQQNYIVYPVTFIAHLFIYLGCIEDIKKFKEINEDLKRIKETEKADRYLDDLIDGM